MKLLFAIVPIWVFCHLTQDASTIKFLRGRRVEEDFPESPDPKIQKTLDELRDLSDEANALKTKIREQMKAIHRQVDGEMRRIRGKLILLEWKYGKQVMSPAIIDGILGYGPLRNMSLNASKVALKNSDFSTEAAGGKSKSAKLVEDSSVDGNKEAKTKTKKIENHELPFMHLPHGVDP